MAENNEQHQTPFFDAEPDWFLGQIVEWANRFGVEFGITINVGGLVVSGRLISGTNYFDQLADQMIGDSDENSIQHQIGSVIRKHKSIYEPFDVTLTPEHESRPEEQDHDETPGIEPSEAPPPATFIHLKDAKIFAPGQPPLPTNTGVLWRGRLCEVDGFSIGQLRAD